MNHIRFGLFTTFLLVVTLSYSQGKLVRQKINSSISMLIASDFFPMESEKQQAKYLSDRTPLAMYSTPDAAVDLGINVNSSAWEETDMSIIHQFYKANLLQLFDEVRWIQDTVIQVKGRTFARFELEGTILDENASFKGQNSITKYLFVQYTLFDNKILLFHFNSPIGRKDYWKESVLIMMDSISIR